MIRRPFILYSFLLLLILQLHANPVTESEAFQLATHFYQLRSPSKLRSAEVIKLVWKGNNNELRAVSTDPAFYIYNIGDNRGFVIVSGEDATKTILGYADEGGFRTDLMPENVQNWLNFYQQEIEAVRSASLTNSAIVSSGVSTIATGSTTVAPLLGNIQWNQTNPYNLQCPWDVGAGSHALAGCVAVAMAQIMKYHRWPVTGIGTHSYTDANYGNQSVDFSKTTYNWDNMLGSYTSGGTSDQNSAVATLIYQCGVAVDMAYSTTSSSSFSSKAAEALVNHFGYDTEIQRYERPYYTSSEWNNLIKKELNNARPVYFSANSDAGGHAFVCDGYDSNSLFHINWGWGGSSNGYFELSSLSTENPGIAGAAPEFVYSQSILTGIHKADVLKTKTNQVVAYNTGLTSTTSSVNKIATSSFTLTYYFANTGLDTVKIRYGIGFSKDGSTTLTKLVENSATTFTTIAPPTITSIGVYKAVMNISNPSVLSNAGKYRLYPIYIPKDSTAWSIMRGSNILNNCMVVTVASNNGSATILPELVAPELVLTGDIQPRSRLYQNNTLHVDLTLKNNGPDFFSKVGLCLINATDPNNRRYICESTVLCSAGETKTFHLKGTVTSPPGNYYLQAQFDSTNSNSTMNYKILKPSNLNNKLTQVLPPSGPPVLQLNNLISMTKGLTVSKTDSINLIASISNTGGYFDSRIIAFVFPKSGGYSLTYLTPIYVYIDSLQTQEMTLTGIPNLDLGEYSVSLYAFQDNNWNLLSPSYMASIDFTVSNGSSSIQKTTESFSILQIGGQLIIKSSAEIQQSKLFDLSGKLLRTGSAEKVIPLEDLAPGVYWLEIQSNGKTIHERFLKQ